MPTPVITPNMDLTEPGVGNTLAPGWALLLNANFTLIDQHNHTTGQGVPIPSAGININADFTLNGHNLLDANSLVFAGAASGMLSNLSLYSNGVDLFYKDNTGTSIQMTDNHQVNVSTGNIQGLPSTPVGDAGITWVNSQSLFEFLVDAGGPGASIDVGSLTLRPVTTIPSPSGNFIQLFAPSALSGGYGLTLPTVQASTNDAVLLTSSSGVQRFLGIGAAGSVLQVNSGGTAATFGTVTAAGMGANSVATASIQNNAVTPAKLSAPNIATSSFSTDSTNGFTPTALSGGSVSLTASGLRPVMVSFTSVGGVSVTGSNARGNAVVRVDFGGTSYLFPYGASWGTSQVSSLTLQSPLPPPIILAAPSAGTVTATMYIYNVATGDTTQTIQVIGGVITILEL